MNRVFGITLLSNFEFSQPTSLYEVKTGAGVRHLAARGAPTMPGYALGVYVAA
jgi:hypothetical protein